MIVYVESNFVLEMAFLREEHDSCEALVRLAEAHKIKLVFPAFSIGEPYETLIRNSKRRRELHEKLSNEAHELSRSKPYRESSKELRRLTGLLLISVEEEKRSLDTILDKVLSIAEVIPIDLNTLRVAIDFQNSRSLKPQDSIVYSSIIGHLTGRPVAPSCFITQNSKDFLNPDIVNELAGYSCRLFVKFPDGLGYIQSITGP